MYNMSNISDCNSSSIKTINILVACLFSAMFPFALLLNGVAAWVSLHLQSVSTFIVYLKKLVMADLLMTVTIPPMAASMLNCCYTGVIFYTSLYMSISFMGLISLDRFFKTVGPFRTKLAKNLLFSKIMSTIVWVVLFGGTAVPTIILTNETPHNVSDEICLSLKSPVGLSLHRYVVSFMEMLFWIFSVLIISSYICITVNVLQSFKNSGSNNSQGKKKTKLRVFLVLLVFFMCFVPFHLLRIPPNLHQIDACNQEWMILLHELALWVASTNACLDPFLYVLLYKDYKEKLADMRKKEQLYVL